jgi:hypothetical protein
MAGRILVVTTLLITLTACQQERPSLPIVQAAPSALEAPDRSSASSERDSPPHPSGPDVRSIPDEVEAPQPEQFCYSFNLLRPRDQRAGAVQARLKQADRMTASFDPSLLTVDLLGDHANILSLQFPVVWPADRSYADHVSSIIEEYFSSADIEDYMCGAGFAEVRLSAWGLNDRRLHPIWMAHVTSEGLHIVETGAATASR